MSTTLSANAANVRVRAHSGPSAGSAVIVADFFNSDPAVAGQVPSAADGERPRLLLNGVAHDGYGSSNFHVTTSYLGKTVDGWDHHRMTVRDLDASNLPDVRASLLVPTANGEVATQIRDADTGLLGISLHRSTNLP